MAHAVAQPTSCPQWCTLDHDVTVMSPGRLIPHVGEAAPGVLLTAWLSQDGTEPLVGVLAECWEEAVEARSVADLRQELEGHISGLRRVQTALAFIDRHGLEHAGLARLLAMTSEEETALIGAAGTEWVPDDVAEAVAPVSDSRTLTVAARLFERAMFHETAEMREIAAGHPDPVALAVAVAEVAWNVLVMCSVEMVEGPNGAYGRPRFDLSLPLKFTNSLERDYSTADDDEALEELARHWDES